MKVLTGNTRLRRGWRGTIVLQVEERVCSTDLEVNGLYWRDAGVEDLDVCQEIRVKVGAGMPKYPRPPAPPPPVKQPPRNP